MRARTTLLSLVCAAGLVLAGCSTGISGVPEAAGSAGGGSVATSSSQQTGSPGAPDPGDGGSDAGSGGDSGLPSASDEGLPSGIPGLPSNIPGLPSGIPGMPTDLGSIPGVDSGCLAVAGMLLSFSVLFLGPMTGQPVTQDAVDQAFANMDQVPAELQQQVQVLHEAAGQMVGASSSEAEQIANSDEVDSAMNDLSDYADSKCGGN